MEGKVFLVGAGPGDPELLTVRALRLLRSADVVLHDDLISPQILELASKNAHVRSVGKRCGHKKIHQEEINALLITYASFGLNVVRLKIGDPLLFGRAGEEIEALRKANVEFEIVPGITSASAAAAALEASLTQRNKASAVVFLTSHQAKDRSIEWKTYLHSGATLAIYMPGSDYAATAANLASAGINAETPCAIVSQASTKAQTIHQTTVRSLPTAPQLPAPTILLVGEVFRVTQTGSHLNADHGTRGLEPVVALPTLEVFDEPAFLGD
jgi:uroporphyrin-III C-methyltransferase